MIVYSANKTKFQNDVLNNDIENIVYETYKKITGRSTGLAEIESWKNSLAFMDRVLNDQEIPGDSGISIEYHIPQTSNRIDFILTGKDAQRHDSAILIELKQWQSAKITDKDATVITRFKHGEQEALHPSYQVWSYEKLIEDYNQTVEEEHIKLVPCAYLHNYGSDDVITNDFYKEYTDQAPVFLKNDALKLREFIKDHVKYGDSDNIMYRIDHGKIRPSKSLADELKSMLKGNQEFTLIDNQKIVNETAIKLARESSDENKQVLIVEGGPGTGKSVVAINLLVQLQQSPNSLVAQYVTRNSAPREVYNTKLTGSFKKSHIASMFRSSNTFHTAIPNSIDALIVDEAHRLTEKSGLFSAGENQIKEIICTGNFVIFFVDEDQKITLKDIGDKDEIRKWAKHFGADITEMELESQFRCNGSDGYLAWLDNTLQIRDTANENLEGLNYDFRILDDPLELHNFITEKNKEKNKARLLAGYCWKWISGNDLELKDIVIGDYSATWNLKSDGQAWLIRPNSVSEVGCIHTSQGLEVDYVGVIVGPDLIVRNGKVITDVSKRATTDKSVAGWKNKLKEDPDAAKAHFDAIIKNTYRTLMTRGQKGCYIYSVDPETNQYFQSLAAKG